MQIFHNEISSQKKSENLNYKFLTNGDAKNQQNKKNWCNAIIICKQNRQWVNFYMINRYLE